MRQFLVEEGLERYVARTAPPDQEKWRHLGLGTQLKYPIRLILVGEGLERHVRIRAHKHQEQRRPMSLYTRVDPC